MTKIRVNLIPIARRETRRRRRNVRGWTVSVSSIAGFLVLTFLVSRVVWRADDVSLRHDIERVQNTSQTVQGDLTNLSGRIGEATTRMNAEEAVGQQPDWSVLLGVVASTLEDLIVLEHCAIEPDVGVSSGSSSVGRGSRGDGAGVRKLPTAPERFRLVLSGFGRTPQDVSMFALRLEQHELFQRVRLSDTKREPFLNSHATSFRIECELGVASGTEVATP